MPSSQSDQFFASLIERNRNLLRVTMEDGRKLAEQTTTCKRKGVMTTVFRIEPPYLRVFGRFINGPSKGIECSGVVGGCGCVHAESKAAIRIAEESELFDHGILVVCSYSPCTPCAHVLVLTRRVRVVVWDILTLHDKRGADVLRAAGVYTEEM